MKLEKFHSVLANTPEKTKEHVKLSMDILDRINDLLDKKFNGKQKLLADKMGKNEAEISKWFNGVQNFTTKTLIKLQIAFGEPIIAVCTHSDDQNSVFTQVKKLYNSSPVTLVIDEDGELGEISSNYEPISISMSNKNLKPTLPA